MQTKITVRRTFKTLLLLFILLPFVFTANSQTERSIAKMAAVDKSRKINGTDYLNIKIAQSYVRRYQRRMQNRVNKWALLFGGHQDAYNIFFDTGKLYRIIDTAIKVTKQNGTVFCGLRFYYAKYPRNYHVKNKQSVCCVTADNKKYKYGLMHTLLIVPQECDPKEQKPIIRDITAKEDGKTFILAYGTKDVIADNQGTLCPPLPDSYCRGTELMRPRRR